MDPLLILGIVILIGCGYITYKVMYPMNVKFGEPPTITLAPPPPLELTPPSALRLDTSQPLSVTTTGVSIPLKGPEKIDLIPPSQPLTVNYGNPPELHFAQVPDINFGPPPSLKITEVPLLKMTGFPTTIPLSNIPTALPLSNVPTALPLSNVPTSIPLNVNYGVAPQLKLADIPPLQFGQLPTLYIKNTPCDGLSDTCRDIGDECYQHLWQNAGCLTKSTYNEWARRQNKAELQAYVKEIVNKEDAATRKSCYGDIWQEMFLPKAGEILDGFQHGWRRCNKCKRTVFPSGSQQCAAGSTHTFTNSPALFIPFNITPTNGTIEKGWTYCSKCSSLVKASAPGQCVPFGPHTLGSAVYGVYTTAPTSGLSETGLRHCTTCGILYHTLAGNNVCSTTIGFTTTYNPHTPSATAYFLPRSSISA